jgi:hypothetical protein
MRDDVNLIERIATILYVSHTCTSVPLERVLLSDYMQALPSLRRAPARYAYYTGLAKAVLGMLVQAAPEVPSITVEQFNPEPLSLLDAAFQEVENGRSWHD